MDYEHTERENRGTGARPPSGQLTGPVGIRDGRQVTNKAVDQAQIISLLNKIPIASGGTLGPTGPTVFRAPRDGFCDPSMSKQIKTFQEHFNLTADGVVDPTGHTFPKMKQIAAFSAPVAGRLFGSTLATIDVSRALFKVDKALASLNQFRGVMSGPTPASGAFDRVTEDALRTHFRLAPFGSGLIAPIRAVKLPDIDHLLTHFLRIRIVLASKAFDDGSPKNPKTNRVVAAAAFLNSGRIIFSSFYRNFNGGDGPAIGQESRVAILIHEGMHAVDSAQKSGADDVHISEFVPAYDIQPTDKSLFNPSSFASFAAHVTLGRDPQPRFGLDAVGRFF